MRPPPRGFVPYFEHLVGRIIEKGGVEAAARIQRDVGLRGAADLELPDGGLDPLLLA